MGGLNSGVNDAMEASLPGSRGLPVGWSLLTGRSAASDALAKAVELPEPIARILLCRGLGNPGDVGAFLRPTLDQLHNPYRMLGMTAAVERLRAALVAREPILLYGDYDVDGTVATVLLKTALERMAAALGVTADVRYHIPHRLKEGYGLQASRLAAAAEEGVRLVVSVDTGIRAFGAAEEAQSAGLDLIVTDHHLPDGDRLPEAIAVLNPNQPGCGYPCKELCGAGVAFKLAQALLESVASDQDERQRLGDKTLPSFLKLLAIATIADAVPLTGENRIIAVLGLRELRKPAQVGLRALMELAGIDLGADARQPVSATDVGFRLAPRINAAGRMDIASDVVELFLTRDLERGRMLAEKLHRLNDERRATEAEALRAIEAEVAALAEAESGLPACLVLADAPDGQGLAGWHRGVIGILASRVVDRTGRPALVLSHEGGEAHGSGRSVPGFHLLDALTEVHGAEAQTLFTRFGGHAHAVGFSLPTARVETLRERLSLYAAERLGSFSVDEEQRCDLEVRLADLTPAFRRGLEAMEPFGMGNPEPTFFSRSLRLVSECKVIKEKHLRLILEDLEGGARLGGMAWSRRVHWAERAAQQGWAVGGLFDLAFRLRQNRHPDFGGWEMEVVAMRPCAEQRELA